MIPGRIETLLMLPGERAVAQPRSKSRTRPAPLRFCQVLPTQAAICPNSNQATCFFRIKGSRVLSWEQRGQRGRVLFPFALLMSRHPFRGTSFRSVFE